MRRATIPLVLLFTVVFTADVLATAPPHGTKPLPWLGMAFTWLPVTAGHRYLQVQKVTKDGPSERAGLRAGDVITTVNGNPVDFGDDLEFILYLSERKPGEKIRFGILRDRAPAAILVIVGTMPEPLRPRFEASLRAAQEKRLRTPAANPGQ